MLLKLTYHFLLDRQRRVFESKSIILNIFITLLLIYLISATLFAGYFLDKALLPLAKNSSIMDVFNQGLFYYFLIDLILRGILQHQSSFEIKPYLYLPIKKKTILHFLQVKSLFSIFNFFPFLLILPFYFKVIVEQYPTEQSFVWLGIIVLITLINNTFSYNFGKTIGKKFISWFLIMSGLFLIGYLEYKAIFELSIYWNEVLAFVINNPWSILIVIALYSILYYVTILQLKKELYQDNSKAISTNTNFDLGKIFNAESIIGQLIVYESRLIIRNKRLRTALMASAFFVLYPLLLIYQTGGKLDISYMNFFLGLFQTLLTASMFGQFMFAWEGSFYNFIKSSPFSTKEYLKAKYYTYSLLMLITCLVSSAYGYLSWKLVAYIFIGLIFNVGVNLPMVLFIATYNRKAIDLDSSAAFNYQGVQFSQFFSMLPALILPFFVFIPFTFFFSETVGMLVMLSIGLIGILLHPLTLRFLEDQLKYKKYIMLESFNQK